MVDNQTPSVAEQEAMEKGRRLGFLIASLDISEKERQAFFDLLPEMNAEQLDKLSVALEKNYLNQATRAEDEKFAAGVLAAQGEYEGSVKEAAKTAEEKIKEIEERLAE